MTQDPARGAFKRGLSPEFLKELTRGELQVLWRRAMNDGLDLQIREGYLNIYSGKNSVLKLEELPLAQGYEAEVHHKYNPPGVLLPKRSGDYQRHRFSQGLAPSWAKAFAAALPGICAAAKDFDGEEGRAEFELARENRQEPFFVVDRQVQLPGIQDSKVDLVAVEGRGENRRLVLVELKQGTLSIDEVLAQVDRYAGYYAPKGRLIRDVAESLQRVIGQKQALGILDTSAAAFPLGAMAVDFLVVLVTPEGSAQVPTTRMDPSRPPVSFVNLMGRNRKMLPRGAWRGLRVSS